MTKKEQIADNAIIEQYIDELNAEISAFSIGNALEVVKPMFTLQLISPFYVPTIRL